MKLGSFEVPDVRLIPTTVDTLDSIYKVKKREKISSKDLAIFLGFKYGTEPHFYRKIHSLSEYGLIEGKGIFQVSELGGKLLHPRDVNEKNTSFTEAVLNVPLWNEIYKKHGKQPREDNFWAVLMDITKIDPDSAKKNAIKILGWYLADIEYVKDNVVSDNKTTSSESLKSSSTQDSLMSEQILVSNNDKPISFANKYHIYLPKGDLEKEYEKFTKYMELYINDYKEEKAKLDQEKKSNPPKENLE